LNEQRCWVPLFLRSPELKIGIAIVLIFALAVLMTMTGRGGGNFYVLVLVIAGIPMHNAATTAQFILFTTAFAAIFIFQKNRVVSWPVAIILGGITAIVAFMGGFSAHVFTGMTLKFIFSGLLVIAGFLMLLPVKEPKKPHLQKPGYWRLRTSSGEYVINLWLAVPVALATGFGAGMVGVSGGSFLVPLMVLACRLPMKIAVGTASTMVAATALMGFLGHAAQGDFELTWALALAGTAIAGGIIGGKITIKTRPGPLKMLFAFTTLAAAIFMAVNAIMSK
jgi:uncharacterized membrane protein YfcA